MGQAVIRSWIVAAGMMLATQGSALAGDLAGAPPSFGYRNQTVVPIDIDTVHVEYVFDVATSTASARAVVNFAVEAGGLPMLDMVPEPSSITLDGETIAAADFPVIDDPHSVTRMRIVKRTLAANSRHELEVSYLLSASDVTFSSGKVRTGFFMSDLTAGGREFMEQFAPSNFEFDQIHFSFDVRVENATADHEVFTNGAMNEVARHHWTIDFPSYFTTSSPYFHLADKGRFQVERFTYQGVAGEIPVTVYAESASNARSGATNTRSVMAELERDYGAFAHDRIVVYVTPDGGGMEHCGATMTSLWALEHELTHSWFARGVMPSGGNAGWIDEAVASWRDNGYPRARSAPNRSPVNLGGFSAYRRHTTRDAYTLGATLISEFDFMFAGSGGMKAALRQLFTERKRSTISVPFLQTFLEGFSGQTLGAVFNRYVYGQTSATDGKLQVAGETGLPMPSKHPRPYTKEELARYR